MLNDVGDVDRWKWRKLFRSRKWAAEVVAAVDLVPAEEAAVTLAHLADVEPEEPGEEDLEVR